MNKLPRIVRVTIPQATDIMPRLSLTDKILEKIFEEMCHKDGYKVGVPKPMFEMEMAMTMADCGVIFIDQKLKLLAVLSNANWSPREDALQDEQTIITLDEFFATSFNQEIATANA